MAMNGESGWRLACGRELARLVDQVADGLPPAEPEHQRTCLHCQAALGELEDLWGQVRALAREEIVAPERIVSSVIRRIHEGLAATPREVPLEEVLSRLVRHALLETDHGTTRIADSVVAKIVDHAVRGLRGVGLTGGPPSASVAVNGSRVTIRLPLAIRYGVSLAEASAAARMSVIEQVEGLTGLVVDAVDISVEDVFGADAG
ncbi:MAG: Asp23/Gls24 family envelope stress response protein [Gaiellaceae bacterium]